jgi:MFS family permease
VFIATIDTVIVAASLPAIAASLHATSNEAYWCGSGFLFAQTVAQPIYGGFTDIVSHKSSLMLGLGLFTLASVFCATAQNMAWLVTARTVSKTSFIIYFRRNRRSFDSNKNEREKLLITILRVSSRDWVRQVSM